MFSRFSVWLILAALVAAMSLRAEEQNAWPFAVRQGRPDGPQESAEYAGPLFFTRNTAVGDIQGFRPIYLHVQAGEKESRYFVYPLFTWEKEPGYRSFSFFQLINRRRSTEPGQREVRGFEIGRAHV